MTTQSLYNDMVEKMIDHVDNKTTDMAEDTLSVPSSAYTDPQIWQQEMDLIFKNRPVFVAMSNELPEPGCYKTLQFLDKPLLITRLADGSVRVMLNVCPHRAMQVVTEESGKRSRFTCSYHGWSFRNDGSLLAVSEPAKFGEVDKDCNGLPQLPSYEHGGMIFTVLNGDTTVNFEEYLGGMIKDIARLGFEHWHYCGKRTIYGANWKIAYDGYLEGYHFATAHPKTVTPRTYSNIMQFENYGPHILLGFPQRSIDKLKNVDKSDYWKHENDGYDFIRLLFPNVSIFVAPEITQIAQIIPGPTPAENTTHLYFIHPEAPQNEEQQQANENMMEWLRDVVDEEDYFMGLKIQKGVESNAHTHVTFGRNERGNQFFHKWVDYCLADDPGLPEPKL
ncbi:Rieske 2Fe-2S domain-containing protein [Aestuariicella hydrocarbonica]|uniref:Rieske 2Fe-2S domain-containing protein n=1 Tax=Pseudomaricurvus hydrocarbonicus TaxID=1470433 RepID=A0A9E5JY96_9GAMM|nr:SRPBCC family protein [Aestuariicella hydrocarbonica]NHO66855.1 Rieske 2Fe-2S domain-containing protein [Aestuariicella hydrocarbonica]